MTQSDGTFYLNIPEDIAFSDLEVMSDPVTNNIIVNMVVVNRVLKANKINIEEYDEDEFLASMLLSWYEQWLAAGGKSNAVMEQMRADLGIVNQKPDQSVQPSQNMN